MKEHIQDINKIIIKIGTSTITSSDGHIDKEFLNNLAFQVRNLMDQGKKVIIVSSGARIAGVSSIGKWSRQKDMHYKQALCAIGQVELMDSYRKIFIEYDLHVGQILLTKGDFGSEHRSLNIRNTLFTLLDEGVVPVINENDTIAVDEIKIGDNDMLAARSSVLWGADLLVILSDIDGIYDKNPSEAGAKLIKEIKDVDDLNIEIGEMSSFGTGGIETKIKAAKLVNSYNIPMIVAKGKERDLITQLFEGKKKGTIFLPKA